MIQFSERKLNLSLHQRWYFRLTNWQHAYVFLSSFGIFGLSNFILGKCSEHRLLKSIEKCIVLWKYSSWWKHWCTFTGETGQCGLVCDGFCTRFGMQPPQTAEPMINYHWILPQFWFRFVVIYSGPGDSCDIFTIVLQNYPISTEAIILLSQHQWGNHYGYVDTPP